MGSMSSYSRRVLIACYGGGHVHSLIPVAQALQRDPHVELTVLGFTTARAAFERRGVPAHGYQVLEKYLERPCDELIEAYIGGAKHPDITAEETRAYFHVGLHDLICSHGKRQALRMLEQQGRVAFLPEATFARYLDALQPDLVITSTSPRSELALQRAACRLAIPGLAVSDLFLQHEAAYLCGAGYARHITVIADYVAEFLRSAGCARSTLHVTGNPAFDCMFGEVAREAGGDIREAFGIGADQRLLTWVGTPSDVSIRGKPFIRSECIIEHLESFCAAHPGHRFAYRPHPNRPVELPPGCTHGVLLGPEYPVEGVLWASDAVLLETSTVGLQAALIGRPVITIAADGYPPYAALELATDVPDLLALDQAILDMAPPRLDLLGPVGLGDATERVLQVIAELLGLK